MLVAEEAVEIRVLKRQGKEHSQDRADARVGARATTTDANPWPGLIHSVRPKGPTPTPRGY
jgi:hypothetical protein